MQRPSAVLMLILLCVVSWIGYMATQLYAAEGKQQVRWEYVQRVGQASLNNSGLEGWEAYAVFRPESGGSETYYLKRPVK